MTGPRTAALGPIAGWSLQSWALIGLGHVLAAIGWARWAKSRRGHLTCHHPIPAAHGDAATDQSADSTTDVTMRGTNP